MNDLKNNKKNWVVIITPTNVNQNFVAWSRFIDFDSKEEAKKFAKSFDGTCDDAQVVTQGQCKKWIAENS